MDKKRKLKIKPHCLLMIHVLIVSCARSSQTPFVADLRLIPGAGIGYTLGGGINANVCFGISFFYYEINKKEGYSGINIAYVLLNRKDMQYGKGY